MMFAELIEVAGRSSNFASLRMRTQTIERTFLLIPMMRYRIISPLLLTASLVPSRRTRYLLTTQTVIAGRPRVAVNGYSDDNMESRCAFSGGGPGARPMKDAGADAQQLKSALAAEIRRMLDAERLSVREAQARTGIAA